MNTLSILSIIGLFFILFFWWAFRTLPGERWQIIASIPLSKREDGKWEGINLTYYGFLLASAGTLAGTFFIFLLISLGVQADRLIFLFLFLFVACGIAARIIAFWVEKKKNTFTVGGAAFTGILLTPLIVEGLNSLSSPPLISIIPTMAALTIAYSFGEGTGRIACISFGCCYGKPIEQMKPFTQYFFKKITFVFEGKTKKISYASGLDGHRMFPVQGITALVYVLTGLLGLYLFLEKHFIVSFLLTAIITQGWRAYSELLRSDYRGGQKISVYQVFALIGIFYSIALVLFYGTPTNLVVDYAAGFKALWNPGTILGMQLTWLLLFLYTGLSKVTGSRINFHIKKERI